MAYVAVSDIDNEFKAISFASGAAIGSSQILEFISQEEAKINGAISSVYEVPVASSATIGFAIMRAISTQAIKARVLDILAVKTGKSDLDQGSGGKELYDRVWDLESGLIAQIKDRSLLLVDATLIDSGGGVRDYNSENNITQTFKATEDQW